MQLLTPANANRVHSFIWHLRVDNLKKPFCIYGHGRQALGRESRLVLGLSYSNHRNKLKKPACASKQDGLVLATLRYLVVANKQGL